MARRQALTVGCNNMTRLLLGVIATLLLIKCHDNRSHPIFSRLRQSTIAIQPLDGYTESDSSLRYLRYEIESYYETRVVINNPIEIPKSFLLNEMDTPCSADSLLGFLSTLCNDTIVDVIGITERPLFSSRDTQMVIKNNLITLPRRKSIFGLGYINGNSCVVSSFKLSTPDTTLLLVRIRNVTFHEFGHNLGLPHCSSDTCVMSEQNGDVKSLDRINGKYCLECKKKFK